MPTPAALAAEPAARPPLPPTLSAPCHREVLPNGLVLILQEDLTAPLLTLQGWFKAGSIHEHELLGCGMSHFVEHMLFKGTKKRGVGQFARDIAAAGGDLNAYTNYDRTVFHVHVRSEAFDAALDALADVIQSSTFPEDETRKEQEVIVHELQSYLDSPERVLHDLFMATLYQVHPYRFPIGGLVDQFQRLTRDDLVHYYGKVYVPNNAVFLAVGAFRIADALPKVRAAFSDWARKPLPPIYVPQEPRQTAPREAVREFRTRTARLLLGWHTVSIHDGDLFPLDVLSSILGQGDASRLVRIVRDRKGLVHDIGAGNHTPVEPGYFYVHATLEPDKLDAARAAILDEVRRFATEPVSAEELASAQRKVLADHCYQRQTIEGQAAALGMSELVSGGVDFDRAYLAGVQKVTADGILRVARRWFGDDNLTVAILKPQAEAAAGCAAGGAPVVAVAPPKEAAARTAPALLPAAALARLDHGATLCVVENHKLPIVSVYATCLGGVRFETPETNGVSHLMAQLLTRGTATRAAEEIARRIESVGGRLDPVSGKNSFGLRLTVLKPDLALGLELLADCLAHPAFPAAELEQVRAETLALIRNRTDQVWDANTILFNQLFYREHPYSLYQFGTLAAVAQLRREQLAAFHARYCVPANLVVAVAGDVTPTEAEAAVRTALGGLGSGGAAAAAGLPRIGPVPEVAAAVKEVREMPEKNLAAILWGFKTVANRHPDRYVLDVLAHILGKMGGRLFVHLRDQKALAYNVGCFSAVNLDPGYFGFYIVAQPQNIDAALAAMRVEIEAVQREPVPGVELATAKNSVIGGAMGDLQTMAAQAEAVGLDQLYGLGYLNHFELPQRIGEVTQAEIQRAARQYFDLERSVLAITKPAPREGPLPPA